MSLKKISSAKSAAVIKSASVADYLTLSAIAKKPTTTAATAADVADLVEYAINEAKPNVKTKRGADSAIELKIGRRKFIVSVLRPVRRKSRK